MKSRTLSEPIQQPHHISSISVQSPLGWKEEQKTPARSRLVDSFQFMMNLINADPYPMKDTVKKVKSFSGKLNVTYGDAWPFDGTLRAFARQLGHDEAAGLPEETLIEEK